LKFDVVVIGAGAAGLFCAANSGKRGRKTLVLDHAKRPGKKILISGGGRCNFTNYFIEPEKYISQNPHFCKSALSQYTQWDFISLVEKYGIKYHEKTLGQLFCDDSAKEIVNMLVSECHKHEVISKYQVNVNDVNSTSSGFELLTSEGAFICKTLVIATGGLSMPKLGATSFAYKIADQFNIPTIQTRAGLVPFTLEGNVKEALSEIAGVSLSTSVSTKRASFAESMLFTHRGLSGPAVLQASSYWQEGEEISVNLSPDRDVKVELDSVLAQHPNLSLKNFLSKLFPKSFAEKLLEIENLDNLPLKHLTPTQKNTIIETVYNWKLKPSGTEGYRTAEVTLGGISTDYLSSKTMEVKNVPGLFFIGEAVDVTGWLGGYNFQWAWSSGYVAGMNC
jgi:predicted Rossmann fold flavoprotein